MNRSVACVALGFSLGALRTSLAQVAGIPSQTRFLVYSKAAIALDGGGAGSDGPVSTVLGTTASALFGWIGVNASGSMVFPSRGSSFLSYGASADVSVIHVGVAHWDSAGTSYLNVPLGLWLPLAWCVGSDRAWFLWVGGRRDFERVAPASTPSYSNDAWAYTVGFAIDARKGVGFQLAGGKTTRSNRDWSLSAGVHLALRALPSGSRSRVFSDTSTFNPARPCGSLPGELAGH